MGILKSLKIREAIFGGELNATLEVSKKNTFLVLSFLYQLGCES